MVAEIGDVNAMNQIYHELQLVTDNYLGYINAYKEENGLNA